VSTSTTKLNLNQGRLLGCWLQVISMRWRFAVEILVCCLLLSPFALSSDLCGYVQNAFAVGNAYSSESKDEIALEVFQKGAQFIDIMNETELLACNTIHKLYHNLALQHSELGHNGDAKAFFLSALESKIQGTSLVQLGVFLSSVDEVEQAYRCLQEAKRFFPDNHDLDILAATLFPAILKSSESSRMNIQYLNTRLSVLEEAWKSFLRIPQQENPQSLIDWSPTIYRLHYASFDVHENLIFLKRKARLNSMLTKSLNFVAPRLSSLQWHQRLFQKSNTRGEAINDVARRKRVGFLTTDWCRSHSLYMHGGKVVEKLSREKFQVFYIRSLNHGCASKLDTVDRAFPHLDRDIYVTGDLGRLEEARYAISRLELDILVFMEIGMNPWPYFLAFARLAVVQMSTWCFVATSGLEDTIDYFISADHLEPDNVPFLDSSDHYGFTEQVVRFDESPWILGTQMNTVRDYKAQIENEATMLTKGDFGVPSNAPLVSCVQTIFKYHPSFDSVLASVLHKNTGAHIVIVLAIKQGQHEYASVPIVKQRMRQRLGPSLMNRVHFFDRLSRPNYLSLISISTVVLDTLPWSAFTTAFESIMLGTPLVTLPGRDIRGRFAYRLYKQMGVMDLVAPNRTEYVNIVSSLCENRARFYYTKQVLMERQRFISSTQKIKSSIREWETFFNRSLSVAFYGF
jgi:protein O-GlcNAc transferase